MKKNQQIEIAAAAEKRVMINPFAIQMKIENSRNSLRLRNIRDDGHLVDRLAVRQDTRREGILAGFGRVCLNGASGIKTAHRTSVESIEKGV